MRADPCPTCGKPYTDFEQPTDYLPFCSARCKNIDLGKWLDGHYSTSRPLREDETWSHEEPEHDDRERN